MKKLQFTLNKNILKKDYKWLNRDFKEGETVFLFTGNTYGCIGENGIACCLDANPPFFELPATALSVNYFGKDFTIFMMEQGSGYNELYCMEPPFDRMETLTKIQGNTHLVPDYKLKPPTQTKKEFNPKACIQVLVVKIQTDKIEYRLTTLNDIAPLF